MATFLAKAEKFKSFLKQLSKDEYLTFMGKLFDRNYIDLISTALFEHFINSQSNTNNTNHLNNISSMLSEIIQSRKIKPKLTLTHPRAVSTQNVKNIVNPNSTPLMDDDSILILNRYVRIIEQKYTFFYAIPNGVIGLCARFYGGHFFQLEDATSYNSSKYTRNNNSNTLVPDKPSPFSVLFATLNMSSALSINGWDSLDLFGQCSCLERDKINTDIKRRAVVDDLFENTYKSVDDLAFCGKYKLFAMITNFYVVSQQAEHKRKQYLFGWEFMRQWTTQEMIISMMDHFINDSWRNYSNDKFAKIVNSATPWMFVEMYRRFCNDEAWDGTSLYNFLHEITANGTKLRGFGLRMFQKIFSKYSLKFGPFAKCKKEIGMWAFAATSVDPSIMSQIKGENK